MALTKNDNHTALRRLHKAVTDIVQGTRAVFTAQGKPCAELRLPVLFHGTDMRVTIEAGPGTAMRNALEHAQMQATDKPAPEPGLNARLEAMALLALYASEIEDTNTLSGRVEWDDEDEKKHFHRIVSAMRALSLPEHTVKP